MQGTVIVAEVLDALEVIALLSPLPMVTEIHGAGRGLLCLGPEEIVWALTRAAERTELRDECWWWTGYTRNGYGSISARNSSIYLHVLALAITAGPFQEGEEACHTCDHRPCWRPEHLFKGTRSDNVHDMWRKGRAVAPPRMVGERQHLARLTDVEVAEIRQIAASGVATQRTIAEAYGCSQSTVWRLTNGMVRA